MLFRKRKIAKKLAEVGSCVDTCFMVYINNDEPVSFPSKDAAVSFISLYRENTEIFKLQIYRIETYSL